MIPLAELLDVARSPLGHEAVGIAAGGGWILTDLRETEPDRENTDALAHLACVLVAVAPPSHQLADAFDVVVDAEAGAADVVAAVDAHPIAVTTLALLLRGCERRTVVDGLIAESATYSALQSGPEHQAWLRTRVRHRRTVPSEPLVRVTRTDETLHVTLNRPDVRNAYNAATRDALLEALTIATSDASVVHVVIDGTGATFCSGGDLDEFGSLADPATAHLLRLARSVAHTISELRARTTVHVHGACIGAGIELPAFAGRIVARDDSMFQLPEVAMGLVPGAGGTVSIPRRIGRHRTAWMAITGARVEAATALDWGLVDDVVAVLPEPPHARDEVS
jgi:enoyl-CoA hydratase/carnithine racemase